MLYLFRFLLSYQDIVGLCMNMEPSAVKVECYVCTYVYKTFFKEATWVLLQLLVCRLIYMTDMTYMTYMKSMHVFDAVVQVKLTLISF